MAVGVWAACCFARAAAAQAPPPTCTPAEEKLWQRAQDTLGLFVVDDRRYIGGAASIVKFDDKGIERFLNPLLAGYHPASGFKELACGTLDKWSLYVLGENERDLHPHIKLTSNFKHLVGDMPLGSEPVDFCVDCIFGEVTVPREFEWFWKEGATKPPTRKGNKCGAGQPACVGKTAVITRGAKFCAYGPWIMEKAHRYWPEIHPVQAFWGQANDYASLYIVVDDSRRFQKKEHFGLGFLSPENAIPWGTRFAATLYQVVRIDPAQGGAVNWEDDQKQSQPRASINTGAGHIGLSTPPWIEPSLAGACTTGNRTQAIVQATLQFDADQRWRGLNISGTGTGIAYGRGTSTVSTSDETKPVPEPRWSATTRIGWEDHRGLSTLTTQNLAPSVAEWGVHPTETRWFGVARQQLEVRPEVLEGDRNALLESLRSEWTVSIVDLNNRAVPPSRGFRVQLRHPKSIPTSVNGPIERVTTNDSRFTLTVMFDAREVPPNSNQYHFENLKASVTLRLFTPDASFDHAIQVYSLVPDFLTQVAGYDLEAQKGAFPPKLSQVIVPWLVGRGCRSVTMATWSSELDGKARADFAPAPLWEVLNRRLRTAGIVRQTVNLMLGDRTVDAVEFQHLMKILEEYRDACVADPPRP